MDQEAWRAGVRCPTHDLPWCAPCGGHDRKSIQGSPDGRLCYDVVNVTVAHFGGRCPSCGDGFRDGQKIGWSHDLEGWVPLKCCGYDDPKEYTHRRRPTEDNWRNADARRTGVGYADPRRVGALPETTTDDHLEDAQP